MRTRASDLLLLEDLEAGGNVRGLPELRAVAEWITAFVVRPHEDLGRPGPVCPFVPGALERRTLWLAPEQIAGRDVPDVIELMRGYTRRFLDTELTAGDDAIHKVIVVVFTDVSAQRARAVFDEVLAQLAVPSYVEDGIVFGPFYEGNEGTALYNPSFRPFQSPAPLLFVRQGVLTDWKFFLDDHDWLEGWAHRFGPSAAHALAEELRRLPWRERHD